MPAPTSLLCFLLLTALGAAPGAEPGHEILLQGNGRLARIDASGTVTWEMKWGAIHDLHVLDNGHILVQQGAAKVVEIDPRTREVIWSHDSAARPENAGRKVEVHSFQPLPGGRILLAESGPGRLIEIDRDGNLLHEVPLKRDRPHPHGDTRLVRKLPDGHYLVAQESDGHCREYAPDGTVVWEYEVPMFGKPPAGGHGPEAWGNRLFAAVRLANGNTLISTGNGHGLLEVTPAKEIVWQIAQHDLPGITLAWTTTIEVLPNGHYVLGNCHAGPGQPLLVEVDPTTKSVVWQFDGFESFGNSVSNSLLLDQHGQAIR